MTHKLSSPKSQAPLTQWLLMQPGDLVCLAYKPPDGTMHDEFYDVEDINIREFVEQHQDANCYFVPHLFKRPRRIKENAIHPRGLWADLDKVDPACLGKLRPTIAWSSSPGRWAALWATDKPVAEELNRRLTYHIGADKGCWNLGRLLRLPNSRNWKYPDAPRARLLWANGPSYKVSALERILPNQRPPQPAGEVVIETVATPWRDILAEYGLRRLNSVVTDTVRVGSRSGAVWKIGRVMREAGASPGEVACVLLASKCFLSKWGTSPRALRREINNIWRA